MDLHANLKAKNILKLSSIIVYVASTFYFWNIVLWIWHVDFETSFKQGNVSNFLCNMTQANKNVNLWNNFHEESKALGFCFMHLHPPCNKVQGANIFPKCFPLHQKLIKVNKGHWPSPSLSNLPLFPCLVQGFLLSQLYIEERLFVCFVYHIEIYQTMVLLNVL